MPNLNISLKELIDVKSGYAFKSKLFNSDKGTPLIRIRNITSGKTDTLYDGEYKDEYLVYDGDLLVSMDGEFKLVRWGGGKALLNQRTCKVIVKDDRLLEGFLYYFLPMKLKKIEDKTSFVTVKHLSVKDINEILINLPPLETQKKIVEVLEQAQLLIDLRKKQIELLDQLIQSVFYDMFGDPVANPKGWESISLEEVCEVNGGKRVPKGKKLVDYNTGYPYLRVTDLKNYGVIEDDIKYITEEVYRGIKNYHITSDDVYLTNVGVNLGMTGIIPEKLSGSILTENAVKLIFQSEILNKYYLSYYLSTSTLQAEVMKRKLSAGVPKLAIFRIKELQLSVPPIELQNQFAEKVEKIEQQKQLMQNSLTEMENNLNSLMQRAFKGELF